MRPELSFDGHGINGPDAYRSRIATFTNADAADAYGKLFANAPNLLAACKWLLVAGQSEGGISGLIFPDCVRNAEDFIHELESAD